MADSLHEIFINTSPDAVFRAWTTEAGQSSWWTKKCRMADKLGEVNIFSFDNGRFEFHFRIDEAVPGKRIRWTGIEAPKMPQEWVGTSIEVDIEPTQDQKTRMRFGHKNWVSLQGMFAVCNTTWGELMYRLRDYCEGKGRGPLFQG